MDEGPNSSPSAELTDEPSISAPDAEETAQAAASTETSRTSTSTTSASPNSSSSSSQPLPKILYQHHDLTVGDRLVNTYVADQRPNSPHLHRQGFCVGFSGTYGEPKVRMLLDNGQQITVLLSTVHKVAKDEAVFEGDSTDEEIWFADFAEDVKRNLKRVVTELHKRATKVRKRIQQQKKAQHMGQQQNEKKCRKMADIDDDTNAGATTTEEADSKPAAATAASAPSELSTEQKRERLALKRKRLELEVAQKKLAAAQAKATNAQKRNLLHKKKEQEKALTLAASRQATPVPGDNSSKAPSRKKRKLTDLAALRRPAILVQNISSSGPNELVYIQPRKSDTRENDGAEAKSRLPTPQREEKKTELQKRQKEVMERRAELLRKAEMLKQKQQEKRKSLEAEEEEGDHEQVGNKNHDTKVAASDGTVMNSDDEGDDDLDNNIRSGAASEAENDGAIGDEMDQKELLRIRRLELQSAISQQAQTHTELKKSIEVQNLRGMVQTQLGVLTKQGQNLSERTAQLKECTADIEAEREEVEDAEHRLEELLQKKRRLETMAGTVTDKLLESRKKKAGILKGRIADIGGPDAAAGGPLSRGRSRSPRQGGRQSRSKRIKGGAAADFF